MITDTTDITIEPVEGDDLYDYDHYRGCATGAWLWLDCASRTLSCRCASRDRTGMPAGVWHGLALRWQLPALTADAANGLMEDVRDAAERVCDGWERVWDGHNHVGRLDDEGRDAVAEIAHLIERCEPWSPHDVIEPWDAGDWFGPLGSLVKQGRELRIAHDSTDDELDVIAAGEEAKAGDDGYRVRGVREHLGHVRDAVAAERVCGDDDDQSEEVCA